MRGVHARQLLPGEAKGLQLLHQVRIARNFACNKGLLIGRQIAVGKAHKRFVRNWLRGRIMGHGFIPIWRPAVRSPSKAACNCLRARASRLMTVPMGTPVISAASL